MKKIIFVACMVMLAHIGYSQYYQPINSYYQWLGGKFKNTLFFPTRDTSWVPDGPAVTYWPGKGYFKYNVDAAKWEALALQVEVDPVFTASPAATITGTNISNWNTAYSWGNHAAAGYLHSVDTTGKWLPISNYKWVTLSGKPSLAHSTTSIESLMNYNDTDNVVIVTDTIRGGLFTYSSSINQPDSGVIFPATGRGTGYWIRRYDGGVENVKWWGNDYTALRRAITFIYNKGSKYLQLDDSINIGNWVMPFEKRRVILTGRGKIITSNLNNYAETEIQKTIKPFEGEINTYNYQQLSDIVNLIKSKDTIRIGIFGDSRFAGYDYNGIQGYYGDDYTINQISVSNSFADNLIKKLIKLFPSKTFFVYNRSIAGSTLENYDYTCGFLHSVGLTGPWYKDSLASVTWGNSLMSYSPDIIFFGHGMNSEIDASSLESHIYYADYGLERFLFSYRFNSFIPIIVSTPPPNYIQSYGDYNTRVSKMNIAIAQKTIATRRGYNLIDVSRIHQSKRYGFDPYKFVWVKTNNYYLDSLSNATSATNSNATITGDGSFSINAEVKYPFYAISFNLNTGSAFNSLTVGGRDYSVSLTSTTCTVNHLIRYQGGDPITTTYNISISENSTALVHIEFFPDRTDIYLNHKLIGSAWPCPVRVEMPKIIASGSVTQLSNILYMQPFYSRTEITATADEFWSDKSNDGGNGNDVNHDNTYSLNECTNSAVNEFLDKLANVYNATKIVSIEAAYTFGPANPSFPGDVQSIDLAQIPQFKSAPDGIYNIVIEQPSSTYLGTDPRMMCYVILVTKRTGPDGVSKFGVVDVRYVNNIDPQYGVFKVSTNTNMIGSCVFSVESIPNRIVIFFKMTPVLLQSNYKIPMF